MGFAHSMPAGAQLLPDGDNTRFRFWAPDKAAVDLELDGQGLHAMQAQADGWFERVAPARAGARYRFVLDDGIGVPDPASRSQHDGDVHGWSVVIDPCEHVWEHDRWMGRPWQETVIYELHAGILGGYRGVAAHLPELAALGITAIELMPIAEFPGSRNWGYDGVLPYAPATAYGSPDELKSLIDQAHGLGLMVYLDVVYNHFGPDGNYLHAYASPFFDEEKHTPWGAAIDVAHPEVGDYFVQNSLYWLNEYRFDGLRFDAVYTLRNPQWLVALAEQIRAGVEPDRHVHLMLENEGNQASLLSTTRFDAQWNDDFHNAMHVLLTAETDGYYASYNTDPLGLLVRVLGEGFAFQGETMEGKPRGEPSGGLSPLRFVNFLQNHDQIGNRALGDRLAGLLAPDVLEASMALLLLTPAIPMLFMGEEWATRTPFLYFTDHQTPELREAVTEGRRKEFAHFSTFGKHVDVPDPNARSTFDSSRLSDRDTRDPHQHAFHACVAELLRIRHRELVPHLAGAQALGAERLGEKALAARWRLGERTLVVLCNLGATAACEVRPAHDAHWLYGSDTGRAALAAGRLNAFHTLVYMESA
jgi:maltooligosyltrehalose trehalohydrolase